MERGWDHYAGAIEPKSRSGRRTVPLLAILRDYLDEHTIAAKGEPDDLVFDHGAQAFAPTATDKRAKRAKRAWKAAGLDGLILHECRHTFASLLIDAGANPKAIQTFMGHSKMQTTFDVYGHLMPGLYDEVRARMDNCLATASLAPPTTASDQGAAA